MSQPLSRVAPVAEVDFSPSSLQMRPQLAVLAMQVVATGAQMEFRIGALLSHILHTNTRAGIAMYQAVASEDGKRNMIRAAAGVLLADDDAALVEAVFVINKSARDLRNAYAHHMWGHTDELPDALLIADPREMQAALAANQELRAEKRRMAVEWRDHDRPGGSFADQPMTVDRSLIRVVRRPDMEQALLLVSKASARVSRLEEIALEPDSNKAQQARDALRAEPKIQRLLDRAAAQ